MATAVAAVPAHASSKSQATWLGHPVGLYAGVSLNGARVAPDKDTNEDFYGRGVDARKILMDRDVPAGHSGAYESLQRVLPS